MSQGWHYVGDQSVLDFFGRCKARERQRLLDAMNRLAADPSVKPRFTRNDAIGRAISTVTLNGFAISYWLDHFVQEVRVVNVDRA